MGYKVWEDGPAGLGEVSLTTLESLRSLYSGSASTLEELALTRARVTCGDPATMRMVEADRGVLARRRDPGPLAAEVVRIRAQIDERRGNDPFALRYSRGGLLDLELLARYLDDPGCAGQTPRPRTTCIRAQIDERRGNDPFALTLEGGFWTWSCLPSILCCCILIGPLPPSQELRSLASKPSASPDSSPLRKCAYC